MHKLLCSISLGLALVVGCLALSCATTEVVETREFRVEDLEGESVDPFEDETGALQVFIFVREDCPISNRYAPELSRIHGEFGDEARFVLVYPDPEVDADAIRAHRVEYALEMDALKDPVHSLVSLTGVRITPEVAVYRGLQRIYRGRIDDRFPSFGTERAAPTVRDLHDVLSKLIAGEAVEPYETDAVGCHIQDLAP